MPSRVLDFPVFDADNHMYETPDAFIKYLPAEYDGFIKYVQVNGRTKIAVNNKISDYIPNPTFERVAAPGAQEQYFKEGNPEGKSRREILGKGIQALPGFSAPSRASSCSTNWVSTVRSSGRPWRASWKSGCTTTLRRSTPSCTR